MSTEWTEQEYKEEAERLGWTVPQLKEHIRKENYITSIFKKWEEEEDE